MPTYLPGAHPFGSTVTLQDVSAQFSTAMPWEERYRYLIQLGRSLPALEDALKNPQTEIKGCENRVWFGHVLYDQCKLHFFAESESRIIRGLLAILLTTLEGKTCPQLQHYDPLQILRDFHLSTLLTATRRTGVQAITQRIRLACDNANPLCV